MATKNEHLYKALILIDKAVSCKQVFGCKKKLYPVLTTQSFQIFRSTSNEFFILIFSDKSIYQAIF
jgi:hypothetical protein